MLANFHTHTTYCDGKNTPEEIVLYAIEHGFSSLGFSGHGYTGFDRRYCMKDTVGYISEITSLKEKYKKDIQIYLGIEEDAFAPVNRCDYDYIIGSSHYFYVDGVYYPIDSNYNYFKKCIEVFNGNTIKLAEAYFSSFCKYILKRKPDIVGHFDLITKFDEMDESRFLNDREYLNISKKYIKEVLKKDVVFKVNTGAISRGFRNKPYPHQELLHTLKCNDSKLMLSSDSHNIETLCYAFDETREMLKDIGFKYVYLIYDKELKKDFL